MKSRRTFLKNVLLALPLVPALAKVSSRAMTAPQAPKSQEGFWGKGVSKMGPFTLLPSSSISIEQIANSPGSYCIIFTGQGGQIEDLSDEEEEEEEYDTWWGEY